MRGSTRFRICVSIPVLLVSRSRQNNTLVDNTTNAIVTDLFAAE